MHSFIHSRMPLRVCMGLVAAGIGLATPAVACHKTQAMKVRHFDVADRTRDRGTLIVELTPVDAVGLNTSASVGQDDYTNTTFGLCNNKNRGYTAGVDLVPSDKVSFNTVDDFAFGPSTINRVDLPGALLLGYLYRPYTANSFAIRLTYL